MMILIELAVVTTLLGSFTPYVHGCIPGCYCDFATQEAKCTRLFKLPPSLPPTITTLRCDRCSLWELTEQDVVGLEHLRELKLRSAGIATIRPRAFSKLKYLKVVDLAYNLLGVFDFSLFGKGEHLVSLYLQGNVIEDTTGQFESTNTLRELNMMNNRVREIPSSALANLIRLQSLSLGGNLISEIPPYATFGLSSLSYLNLANNKIRQIQNDAFEGLVNLKKLNLNANEITTISSDILGPLHSLSDLDLSSNQLKLTSSVFENLPNLIYLNLGDNGMEVIPRQSYFGLQSLKILKLPGNNLRRLSRTMFEHLDNLETLIIHKCNIKEIDTDSFLHLRSLRFLEMGNNALSFVHGSVFGSLTQLESLWMQNNLFTEIPRDMNLPALTLFDMRNNQLTKLPAHLNLIQSPRLFKVLLDGNLIEEVEAKSLMSFNNLQYLYLSSNLIKTFSEYVLRDIFSRLSVLSIYRNPIHCNCEVSWLKTLRARFYRGGSRLRCTTPHNKLLLSDTSAADLACAAPTIVIDQTAVHLEHGYIHLNCTASGDPMPKVHWEIESMKYGQMVRGISQSNFTISTQDEGARIRSIDVRIPQTKITPNITRFICQANNIAGNVTKHFRIPTYMTCGFESDML